MQSTICRSEPCKVLVSETI